MMTRDEVVAALVARKTPRDAACMYADAWLEYQTATANITDHGVVVAHPRTGAPLVNPYVAIRDGALKKLQGMRSVPAAFLWGDAAAAALPADVKFTPAPPVEDPLGAASSAAFLQTVGPAVPGPKTGRRR